MGSAKVITKEIDLSTRVPSFPGVYGGIVIPALKGPIDKNILVTNETQLLDVYTPDSRVDVGMSTAFFSALAYLQKSNKLWVRRVVNGALFGGASLKSFASPYNNFSLPTGMSDPTAYMFDSVPDVAAVAETTLAVFSQTGSFYDVIGAAKAIQLYGAPQVGHYFWFFVSDGSNVQTDPGLVGTGHQVSILTADTSAQIATKFFNVVTPISAAFTAVNSTPSQVTVTNVVAGLVTPAHAGATGSAAAVTNPIAGAAAINTTDEAILIYQANPGLWGTKVYIKVITYTTSPDIVKEAGAFIIQVFKQANLVVPVESFLCSRVQGALDGFGNNIFVEDTLQSSNYIRAISNTAIAATILPKDQSVALQLTGGTDGSAVVDAQMVSALDFFESRDQLLLTVFMDGGWNTVAFQQAIDTMVKGRGDCVGILGVPFSAEASSSYLDDIIDYKATTLNLDSSYSALYTPHVKVFDKYNNRNIFVGPDGYAGAAISFSASNFEIWFPPAGFKRGSVTVIDLRRRFTEGERDALYDAGINPFRFVPGRGIFIWGQKTLSARPSALDRLNVRLMLIVVEPAVATALEDFLFELNDTATQSLAAAVVSSYMDNIKGRRGVTDYRVVCDATNNSADDVDNGRMNLWLFVKPTRSAEEIPFSVIITATGISFDLAAQLAA